MLRPDRRDRSGQDPTLHARILLFCLGAGCAIAGMYYNVGWLVTAGIVVLTVGMVVRLVGDRRRRRAQEAEWGAQAALEEEAEPEAEDDDGTNRRGAGLADPPS